MLIFVIAAASAWADAAIPKLSDEGRRWVVVGQAYYTRSSVDSASIRRNGTLTRFTVRNDWLVRQRDGAAGMILEVEGDCRSRTMVTLSFLKFGTSREAIAEGVVPPQDRQAGPVVDRTLPGAMLDFACRKSP